MRQLNLITSLLLTLIIIAFLSILLGLVRDPFPPTETNSFEALKNLCNTKCTEIESRDDVNNILLYCVAGGVISEGPLSNAEIIFQGEGTTPYCSRSAFCFNVHNCVIDNLSLTPHTCLKAMCKALIDYGKTAADAERLIRSYMDVLCSLKQGTHVETERETKRIENKTWWEQYFENPNCSKFIS